MSYDILFVPRRPDQSWEDALDEAEGTDVLSVAVPPHRREQWDRIVAALRRRLGEVEESVQDDALEATHVASGLQVSLFPDEAAVTFPYWQRSDVAAFHDQVVDVVGLVEQQTGLSAWDAQTDAPFDGTLHDAAGVDASRRLTESGGTVPGPVPSGVDGTVPDAAPTDPRRDRADHRGDDATAGVDGPTDGAVATDGPTDGPVGTGPTTDGTAGPATGGSTGVVAGPPDLTLERRRALRYVVLGVIIILFALLIQAQGESSTLSGLALAIGVADLLIGALMWRSYRRRAEQTR
ncbi:hypothetical protein [Jannaschia sp. R86511]|uniref:hypothetical protein n=1 Tax=Jannaschia sp. R86511 TaxID=3093853 RepID=UPI0036D27F44